MYYNHNQQQIESWEYARLNNNFHVLRAIPRTRHNAVRLSLYVALYMYTYIYYIIYMDFALCCSMDTMIVISCQ